MKTHAIDKDQRHQLILIVNAYGKRLLMTGGVNIITKHHFLWTMKIYQNKLACFYPLQILPQSNSLSLRHNFLQNACNWQTHQIIMIFNAKEKSFLIATNVIIKSYFVLTLNIYQNKLVCFYQEQIFAISFILRHKHFTWLKIHATDKHTTLFWLSLCLREKFIGDYWCQFYFKISFYFDNEDLQTH